MVQFFQQCWNYFMKLYKGLRKFTIWYWVAISLESHLENQPEWVHRIDQEIQLRNGIMWIDIKAKRLISCRSNDKMRVAISSVFTRLLLKGLKLYILHVKNFQTENIVLMLFYIKPNLFRLSPPISCAKAPMVIIERSFIWSVLYLSETYIFQNLLFIVVFWLKT